MLSPVKALVALIFISKTENRTENEFLAYQVMILNLPKLELVTRVVDLSQSFMRLAS